MLDDDQSLTLRLQGLTFSNQILVLSRIAEARSDSGSFNAAAVISLLDELALPKPRNIAATVSKAVTQKTDGSVRQNGLLRLKPIGSITIAFIVH